MHQTLSWISTCINVPQGHKYIKQWRDTFRKYGWRSTKLVRKLKILKKIIGWIGKLNSNKKMKKKRKKFWTDFVYNLSYEKWTVRQGTNGKLVFLCRRLTPTFLLFSAFSSTWSSFYALDCILLSSESNHNLGHSFDGNG